jgi:hypothetical protein
LRDAVPELRLAVLTPVALAPERMFRQPPGLLPAQAVADGHRRRPDIPVETIADAWQRHASDTTAQTPSLIRTNRADY